jgi:RNA polymerase sigma-70 factor (ECF subfamily)
MSLRHVTYLDAEAVALDSAADVALQMDEEAFRGFYERTSRMLWAYLERMTGDRHAADDLLQDAYYRFLRSGATLESEAHRRHYLFRIATNLARDRFRRARHVPPHTSHDENAPVATRGERLDVAANRRLDLTRAMARLRSRDRAMLWLAYAQGASHEEIADVVGIGRTSVKTMLHRARARLAAFLSPPAERQEQSKDGRR